MSRYARKARARAKRWPTEYIFLYSQCCQAAGGSTKQEVLHKRYLNKCEERGLTHENHRLFLASRAKLLKYPPGASLGTSGWSPGKTAPGGAQSGPRRPQAQPREALSEPNSSPGLREAILGLFGASWAPRRPRSPPNDPKRP